MILVFGKTGQVAQALSQHHDVRCFSREQADLMRPAECADLIRKHKPTAVINAAACTAVDAAENKREIAFAINATAPAEIAKVTKNLKIPFIHISSDYVFNGTGSTGFTPADTPDPLNIYGHSKRAGEIAIQAIGGPYAILRTSWVFSAHGRNFVKSIHNLGQQKHELSIVSDQVGGPTPAAAIADACIRVGNALKAHSRKSGIYHLSGFPDVSWADFARSIFRMSAQNCAIRNINTSEYPTPARRPLNSRLNCATTETTFGITRPDWRIALRQVLTDLEA